MEKILIELQNINKRLDILEKKMNLIIENNGNIDVNMEKLNEHINFVETTYSMVRKPLNFIKSKIDCLMGNHESHDLPKLINNSYDISTKQLQLE